MKKWQKIGLIALGVLFLAGCARLTIFLYNVNRDLDDLYSRVYQLNIQGKQLAQTQEQLARLDKESQDVLNQQISAYQQQIDSLKGQIQYMNDQYNNAVSDYNRQQLEEKYNPYMR